MFKNLANLASLMKQAQSMGSKMQAINDRLKSERVTGAAGGELVVVEMNGHSEVLRVTIAPALIASGETQKIEELAVVAFNQAAIHAKRLHMETMKSLTEGIDVPGFDDALAQLTGQG
ncbi:MAG TPA: YbaB/EbfC family nucleoid-associated protein [Pirellulaceae bacterium]|nr:YbaB/EbfC family nucleoid-associated protein [Pirellulaceae bacterium]